MQKKLDRRVKLMQWQALSVTYKRKEGTYEFHLNKIAFFWQQDIFFICTQQFGRWPSHHISKTFWISEPIIPLLCCSQAETFPTSKCRKTKSALSTMMLLYLPLSECLNGSRFELSLTYGCHWRCSVTVWNFQTGDNNSVFQP